MSEDNVWPVGLKIRVDSEKRFLKVVSGDAHAILVIRDEEKADDVCFTLARVGGQPAIIPECNGVPGQPIVLKKA